MFKEHQAIEEAAIQTASDFTDLPFGRTPIGSRWVFEVKYKTEGSIECHKAQIIAKGYSQQEGIAYNMTFALVIWYNSLNLIIALVTNLDLDMDKLDIKSAFLCDNLVQEIQMLPASSIGLDGKIL